ncbi:hypothetical protein LCGC14_2829170, partial [marine sediment metagenome]
VQASLPGMLQAPDSAQIQSEVFWLIFGFWIITLSAGITGRLLSEYAMAFVFIIGFGLLSAFAGSGFLLWNVAFIFMGAFGMSLILHQGR